MANSGTRRARRSNDGGYEDRDASRRNLQVGVGRAIAHHGELLQGVFENEDGRLHRALVTLPMLNQHALVTFWPSKEGEIRTRPAKRSKAARAAVLTLEYLGFEGAGGDLTIDSAIPVGHGYGSSTADVVAAIRAAAAAAGVTLRRSTISGLAVVAEGASDAIAYGDQALLFAHREGSILEHFGGEFPPLLIVGFRSSHSRPVNTVRLPRARYADDEIQLFRVMRGLTHHSIKHQDAGLLGRVATMSAVISQRHLPKTRFEDVVGMAQDFGACGIQVAHSGTLYGILFDANERAAATRAVALAKAVQEEGFKGIATFALNAEGTVVR